MASDFFRTRTTPDQRAAPLVPGIDAGFVNHRLVAGFLGKEGMAIVDRLIAELPPNSPEWHEEKRIDSIYTSVALEACRHMGVPPLAALLADPGNSGGVVCSTEIVEGSPGVWDAARLRVRWRPSMPFEKQVVFDLSTEHIRASTQRVELSRVSTQSIIAVLRDVTDREFVFWPLIMGAPWLYKPEGVSFDTMWFHFSFGQHFVGDFDEFAKVRNVPDDLDWEEGMRKISERAFKICLTEILGDRAVADWGGERSDHFTSHLTLAGRPVTAAFVLKGPGRGFKPMQPAHLGTNGDQIYRLSTEPAEVLIVQHCHDITPAVRAELRAFAYQPCRPRRYCLIDGRDSFRLLTAYGMVEKALALSKTGSRKAAGRRGTAQ